MSASAPHLRMVIPDAPWTRALAEGRVQISGATYECVTDVGQAPERFVATASQEIAVGENGVRRVQLDLERGAPPLALPVFFGRELMQRNLLVRRDSGLRRPQDLVGKRVGSWLNLASGTGAGVLLVMEQGWGLDLRRIHWCMGDPASLPRNRLELDLRPGPRSEAETLEALMRGELDAAVFTMEPRYWSLFGGPAAFHRVQAPAEVRSLVDSPDEIAAIYRQTGLYPITDVVVVKPWVAERDELPAKLVRAFSEANQLADAYREPAERELARREVELLGEDPHQYHLGPNQRRNLAALLDLFYRMGAVQTRREPEELFVPAALGSS